MNARLTGYTRPVPGEADVMTDAAALRTLRATHVIFETSADARSARSSLADHVQPGDTDIASGTKRVAARMADLVRLALDLRERGVLIRCEGAPSLAQAGESIDQLLRDLVDFRIDTSAHRPARACGRLLRASVDHPC
jgi:hypothetical protein